MKKLIFLLFCSLSNIMCLSQIVLNKDILKASLLFELKNGGSGSGFCLRDSNFMYFVTASHVIVNLRDSTLQSDSLYVVQYNNNPEVDKKDSLKISLINASRNGFLLLDMKNDIAVFKIGRLDHNRSDTISFYPFLTGYTKSSLIKTSTISKKIIKLDDLEIGNDLFTIGYPKSLNLKLNFDFDRPLLRKGIIAGRDLKTKRIITDCPSYFGNSGGPVYAYSSEYNDFLIIGLISALIPLEEHWYSDRYGIVNTQVSNSGYTVVIPIDFILDLIKKFR
jgi:Trypsin-like peptidase domain